MSQKLARVLIIATGGTIAGRGNPGKTVGYKPGEISIADLIESIPQLADAAAIEGLQFANVGSIALTHQDWLRLAQIINTRFAEDAELAGVVVTHGTDTLEETAYFLNLTVKDRRPVVLVGSMRPATALSADGPLNLLNAVKIAACAESCGKGVLVFLNDEIHFARSVTKTNANKVETFQSHYSGPLGFIRGDRVCYYQQPTRLHTVDTAFDVSQISELPRVDIAYVYIMADGTAVDAFRAAGAKGIVVAAAGAGAITQSMHASLNTAAEAGVAVLVCSRTGAGLVGPANAEANRQGQLTGDNLNPQKARVLLSLALAHSHDFVQIQKWINQY
ncbi:MAG: asparaginase [Negativicutes bacterium]|nr:asparaginase [Negativicutes bacterium]